MSETTLYVLYSPASKEIHGWSYDRAALEADARQLGPGPQILTFSRNEAGKWQGQGLPAAPEVAAWRQALVTRLGLTAGLVRQAIIEGWSPEKARAAFQGKGAAELWGPQILAEFGTVERYFAYRQAQARGQIRE